ncbi:MAG: hypothetical protein WCF96_08325 [Eubacteriales bacterium]
MRFLSRLLVFLLSISISLTAILAAENLITRFPDIYVYEFNKTQVLDQIELVYDEQELGDLISNYLFEKTDEFQITAEYKGRELEVFSNLDQISMDKLRGTLNVHLLIALVSLLASAGMVYIMIRRGWKIYVRKAYNYALGIFSSFWVVIEISYLTGSLANIINRYISLGINDNERVLGNLLNNGFLGDWIWFTLIASAVFMIAIRLVIWKFTKERRMFV